MTSIALGEAASVEATVRSAAAGDQLAFARLVAEHHASMARVAYVICGDPDLARDVVQSAWAIAWRRIGSLRDPTLVRPWLVAIAANEARQGLRRRRRERVVDISDEVAGAGAGADPGESVDAIDLQRALLQLTPDERSLLAMRYAAGLDSYDIADQLHISASGVRSRISRVLERLRSDLGSKGETDR